MDENELLDGLNALLVVAGARRPGALRRGGAGA